MSQLCGQCDEKHQATHYCVECQEFMCAMISGMHSKLRATKSHIIQDVNPVADIQTKINKALQELQQAQSDILVQYADALPPRNATSPASVQRANQVFAAFINMGVLINHQRDGLLDMQQSLPRMDPKTLMSVMSSPLFTPDTTGLQRYIATLPPFIDAFGSLGYAKDVAVSRHGQVYVCDADNHRVQVFTPAGEFLRMWSLALENSPTAISAAPWGYLYVIQNSRRVSQFATDGRLVRTWQDDAPIDVATDESQVYVLNNNGVCASVRVFSQEGDLLHFWRVPTDAQSLCTGPDQHVYVITTAVCHMFGEGGKKLAVWGGLTGAKKVRINGSELFVVEETGVRVFLSCGVYVRGLGHSKAPQAVAVNDKRAYICESNCVEIVEF